MSFGRERGVSDGGFRREREGREEGEGGRMSGGGEIIRAGPGRASEADHWGELM